MCKLGRFCSFLIVWLGTNVGASASPAPQVRQVLYDGAWRTPEEVARAVTTDPLQREYRDRRSQFADTAEDHLNLAQWCRGKNLAAEAKAHLQVAVRLAPDDPRPHRLLGHSLLHGQWMSQKEADEMRSQIKQAQLAHLKWRATLLALRNQLETSDDQKRQAATDDLLAVRDPLAIPALEEVLSSHSEAMASLAVECLSNMAQLRATRSLVDHAILSPWQTVRNAATRELCRRDWSHYVPIAIEMLGAAESSESWIVLPDGRPIRTRLLRDWNVDFVDLAVLAPWVLLPSPARTFLPRDVDNLDARRVQADTRRTRAEMLLRATTGQSLGDDQESWWKWWADVNYVHYDASANRTKKTKRGTIVSYSLNPVGQIAHVGVTRVLSSCFGAGTKVWTNAGPTPIDQVQLGELVLSTDTRTSELAYQPVVYRTIRPRVQLVRVRTDTDEVLATRAHPVFVSGRGWTRVVDLKPGDVLCGSDALHTITAISEGGDEFAYNLEVAELATYFVGPSKILVHDNTPILDLQRGGLEPRHD